MPRTQGIAVQNNFTKGLITEGTALNFPANASTNTDNCIYQYTGSVKRRPEIDIEDGSVPLDITSSFSSSDAYTEYTWKQINESGSFSFFVQQQGSVLHFYDISASTQAMSSRILAGSVNLNTYKAANTSLDPSLFPLQYAIGVGQLLCASRAIEPIRIAFNPSDGSFTVVAMDIRIRDFIGLAETTYKDTTRPGFSSVSNMAADPDGIIHYYNLLNQGWGTAGGISSGFPGSGTAIGSWDTARTDMPSNADDYRYYQASATSIFDNGRVGTNTPGTGLATKGHFILSIGSIDRRQAAVDAGYTMNITGNAASLISRTTGTTIGDMTASSFHTVNGSTQSAALSQSFDGNYIPGSSCAAETASTTSTSGSIDSYVGKDLGSGNAKKIDSIKLYAGKPSTNYTAAAMWQSKVDSIFHATTYTHFDLTCTIQLRASNTAPTGPSSGTLLGSTTYNPSSSNTFVKITSNDKSTQYRYVWCRILGSWSGIPMTGTNITFTSQVMTLASELEIFEYATFNNTASFSEPDATSERPQCIAFYAGRAWYAGLNHSTSSNTLYFSQIVERTEGNSSQFDRCFQVNDPTSNTAFDLLATDGGTVRIPEMGQVQRLFVYQTSLVIFATNGVWLIRGNSGAGFTATDYVVRKLSSLGTQSPNSIIDVDGIPYWWGEYGVLRLDYNPQFDSFDVNSISDTTIKTFFLQIPPAQRALAKSAYDPYNKYIYWLYTNDEVDHLSPAATIDYTNGDGYNRMLVYNVRSEAFFPFSFPVKRDADGVEITPVIRGMHFVEDAVGNTTPSLKFTTTYLASSVQYLTYSDMDKTDPTYLDWSYYAANLADDNTAYTDYSSFFVSGYEIDGQLLKFSQANYIILVLEQTYDENGDRIDSGAYLQGVFDFALSGYTGKWSTIAQSSQQIFNNSLVDRSVNWRRLKVRGKGRSIQFRVISETGKPFAIVGWSTWKTGNAEV